LQRSLSHTDRTISHLARILSTPNGIDTTLLTLCYTLTLLHARLSTHLSTHLSQLASDIASKASTALLPGETIIASLPTPPRIARLLALQRGAKSLADLIADYRIFFRLWGMVGIWAWARGVLASPPRDGVVRRLVWAQIAVNVPYQVLENMAYLAQHGVLSGPRWDEKRQLRLWCWSSMFWAADVALVFARLGREWWVRMGEGKGKEGDGEKEDKLRERERGEEDKRWWDEVIVNAAFAPLTIHWSLEEGLVSDAWVGLFGSIAGFVKFRELWRSTA
ncbi:hypothetical protein M501DRAFT_908560, partial [Patellaria atrata CBS 101060]